MKIYYRFSFNNMPHADGTPRSTPNRPPWFDKWKCLDNFVKVFEHQNISLIADGVTDEVWAHLNSKYSKLDLHRTEYKSNAGSFLYSLELALQLPSFANIYFVEDDYVHHEGADLIIEQGLEISPYLSLYDHPDKYAAPSDSKIFMTDDVHWRTTGSTTMTFASRVKNLKEDRDLFYKWCGGDDKWTHDFQLFTALSQTRGLITPIPGYATHCDSWVISRMVDWEDVLLRTS
jgi:hypothetical protein